MLLWELLRLQIHGRIKKLRKLFNVLTYLLKQQETYHILIKEVNILILLIKLELNL
jgi:hypothetical protein